MRTFKFIDFGIQALLFAASFFLLVAEGFLGLFVYFFGFLLWNGTSIILNAIFFRPTIKKFIIRRWFILIQLLAIIGYVYINAELHLSWFNTSNLLTVFLLYTAILPFYYLWMTYKEMQLINKIHDQVNLLDIGQH